MGQKNPDTALQSHPSTKALGSYETSVHYFLGVYENILLAIFNYSNCECTSTNLYPATALQSHSQSQSCNLTQKTKKIPWLHLIHDFFFVIPRQITLRQTAPFCRVGFFLFFTWFPLKYLLLHKNYQIKSILNCLLLQSFSCPCTYVTIKMWFEISDNGFSSFFLVQSGALSSKSGKTRIRSSIFHKSRNFYCSDNFFLLKILLSPRVLSYLYLLWESKVVLICLTRLSSAGWFVDLNLTSILSED